MVFLFKIIYYCNFEQMKVKHNIYLMLQRAKRLSVADAWIYAMRENNSLQLEIIERVKTRLYEKGTDESGLVIGTYSPFTNKLNPKKIVGSHYTFKDTGEFYHSMFILVLNDYFTINANAEKEDGNLFKKYGRGIIGLDKEDLEWLTSEVVKKYKEYVRKVL